MNKPVLMRAWFCSMSFAAVYLGCSDDDPIAAGPAVDGGTEATAPPAPPPPPTGSEAGDCPDAPPATCEKDGDVEKDLRCAGLYACWSTKKIAPGLREYAPAFKLWSDGAAKTRWLELPPGSKIDTTGDGTVDEWHFPVGAKAYKEFKLGGKRVETRRIWKKAEGEFVYSVWQWSADESTATLDNKGKLVPNPDQGGTTYEIPASGNCATCHDGHIDKFLGLDAWQVGSPGATGITLAALKTEGILSDWTGATAFTVPEDSTNKFAKVIDFTYANCSFCHKMGRPAGITTNFLMDLSVADALAVASGGAAGDPATIAAANTPLYQTGLDVNHVNQTTAYPLADWKRIKSKDAAHSVMVARDEARDADGGVSPIQMPPSLSRFPNEEAMTAMKDWINSLP